MSARAAHPNRIKLQEVSAHRQRDLVKMPVLNHQGMLAAHLCDLGIVRRYECPASGRYYEMWAAHDLFGHWCVVTVWGGIGSRRGQLRTFAQVDRAACLVVLDAIEKRRLQRGYVRVRDRPASQEISAPGERSDRSDPADLTVESDWLEGSGCLASCATTTTRS